MSQAAVLSAEKYDAVMRWAVEHAACCSVSMQEDGRWHVLKSRFLGVDSVQGVIEIAFPIATGARPPEIVPGCVLGVTFRRGHKKCIFQTTMLMRRGPGEGQTEGSLILKRPKEIQELQRRVYQRMAVPCDHFIAVRLWEGGVAIGNRQCWPICSGRVVNASVGGVMIDIRADQNPRLSVGDVVGVEITVAPGKPPLMIEAQYRHCSMTGPERLGLGFQFIGLEHPTPGVSPVATIAEFVRGLQRAAAPGGRAGPCGGS